ncbi:class I SAM-dependent methyltransferase [Bacillus sp. FJAT-45350]|uniref:class I SAM-dependent methyltransferase n=1 Tax=Bacillus sp. FJAT-45350 TaxID=2011014 RepID=UPI000BB78147|nr:class I SAM-dependent methyltransferase [Bacillus sp. FJAT-45350]
MKLLGILPFARFLLEKSVGPGDIAVDCTAGNGHDTAFLATLTGKEGHVYSFDVQETAIVATKKRLEEQELDGQVTLFCKGHEELSQSIPEDDLKRIKGSIFNLGYLPGSDKTIVTQPTTTLSAINQLFEHMPKEGLIILVIYHGHDEGKLERDVVLDYVNNIDQKEAHVLQYKFTNQTNNPPFIVAIEKR